MMKRRTVAMTRMMVTMMMIWCFTTFSTLFKSYQNSEGVIIKCSVKESAKVMS